MPLIIVLIILLFCFTFIYAGWRAAPWVPTFNSDIGRIIKLADIKNGNKFYDLGCGEARVVAAAGRQGAKAVGLEVSLLPYIWGLFTVARQKNSSIKFRDFWMVNLNDADIVYFFLMPKILEKMGIKLKKELRPGTKVISYVWGIPGWKPEKVDEEPNRPSIYLYKT